MFPSRARRVLIAVFGAGILATCMAVVGARAATSAPSETEMTLYSVATTAQFMNHADDRARGMSSSPFTPNQRTLVILEPGTEKKKGPFPGDDILYTYKLYSDAAHTKSAGTALYTCYFNFSKNATCDTYYQLKNGSVLLAEGSIPFREDEYQLAVSGGSLGYSGFSGEIDGSAGKGGQRLDFKLLPGAATPKKKLTVFAKATDVQYLNNADDEARGVTNNPFTPALNKLRPKLSWNGAGPFAGDIAVYSFGLFHDAALKTPAGSGVLTCYFNYNHKAFCLSQYLIGGDQLLSSGPVNFHSTRFTLVTTGGTGAYLGARGQLTEQPSGTGGERLTFSIAQ